MQSKGWIWQACLLLTSAFVFSICLPSPAAFGQTETTPQEQAEPETGDQEQDDSSDDAPKSGDDDAPDKAAEGEKQKDEPNEDGEGDEQSRTKKMTRNLRMKKKTARPLPKIWPKRLS